MEVDVSAGDLVWSEGGIHFIKAFQLSFIQAVEDETLAHNRQ
jgi:hypothetical protein